MVRPAFFALAALASAWVLADARRRFSVYATAAWTLLTLLFPFVATPLYLIARMFKRRAGLLTTSTQPANDAPGEAAPSPFDSAEAESAGDPHASERRQAKQAPLSHDPGHDGSASSRPRAQAGEPSALPAKWSSVVLPLVYATTTLLLGAGYFYLDYTSFDARFAAAQRATLFERKERAMREYRAALVLRDDAHTHKLLGLELAGAGRWEEALAEFRAAQRGGEPDARLLFHEAVALDALMRPAEAADVFRQFLQSKPCTRPEPDLFCGEAQARLRLGQATL